MEIKVRDLLGEKILMEDAIWLRSIIEANIDKDIVIDFKGYDRIPATFLTALFSDLIYKFGRELIFKQINVKNLSNRTDYLRVVLGTTFY